MKKPIATIGQKMPPILNDTSCAVTVVPISAPSMTFTDCLKVISPAFTKPIRVRTVILEL